MEHRAVIDRNVLVALFVRNHDLHFIVSFDRDFDELS